ncbi:hypothetical protein Q5P01_006606 [Channa striata]|uniref:Uncharacterized protein n=1 Tax=Channa striata TaxID=64152 RepID=A0AA88N9A9_CHASR|nr:hypothetical protein Q5P01_006606 [Channa striata]
MMTPDCGEARTGIIYSGGGGRRPTGAAELLLARLQRHVDFTVAASAALAVCFANHASRFSTSSQQDLLLKAEQ